MCQTPTCCLSSTSMYQSFPQTWNHPSCCKEHDMCYERLKNEGCKGQYYDEYDYFCKGQGDHKEPVCNTRSSKCFLSSADATIRFRQCMRTQALRVRCTSRGMLEASARSPGAVLSYGPCAQRVPDVRVWLEMARINERYLGQASKFMRTNGQ